MPATGTHHTGHHQGPHHPVGGRWSGRSSELSAYLPLLLRRQDARGSEARGSEGAAMRVTECQECGVRVEPVGPKGGRPRRFCSDRCQGRAARARKPKAARTPRLCSVCGSEYQALSTTGGTCASASCVKERERRRNVLSGVQRKALSARTCKRCGTGFTPAYGDKRRGFCSRQCLRATIRRIGKQVRRARLRGNVAERVDPLVVFGRDKWTCQICKRPTPQKQRGTVDGSAPELDHIVPLSLGGEHTYANTQCACRRCNQAKGAKVLGQFRLAM